jgi:hypothetical protein
MQWIQDFLAGKKVEEKVPTIEKEEPAMVEEATKSPEEILEEKLVPEEELHVDEHLLEEVTEEAKPEGELTIDEHILEEKLAPDEMKLDELLVEEEAVKPEGAEEEPVQPETPGEPAPTEKPPKQEGITCPKCGHLNTPDSWYCQKCGAEIFGFPA